MEVTKPKPKTGRPPKFAPEAAAVVVQHVRQGCPRVHAAYAAGIGRSTLMRWLARGRVDAKGPFRDFRDAIKRAESEAVLDRLRRITAAADKGTWQAAAWWLERCHPLEFATNRKEVRELLREVRKLTADLGEAEGRQARADRPKLTEGVQKG